MSARDAAVTWRRWLDRFRQRAAVARDTHPDAETTVATNPAAIHGVPVAAPATRPPGAVSETELDEGDLLGVWRLRRLLGSGGMGAVYLAERADGHFQQQAAIKLIRGQAGVGAFVHFARERQILAKLQHPHIARLLDGGATPGGQPYLVMEYVEGVPIDAYCREHALDLRARLHLFREVCAAVQFAHQRLIVHCDLKPSNVLVRADGTPVLLDFGIARALDRPFAPDPADTAYFTPGYASPEQQRGEPLTTASDIHALGLILFELVSGRKAYADVDERTLTLLTRGSVRSSQRAEVPWRARIRGDLDAIVRHASAEQAGARYASALALASDVERFEQHRPVHARAPTLAYRSARLLRRHWAVALATLLFLVVLGVFTWQLEAERDRARAAEHDARAQAAAAGQVSDFLVSVFNVSNPRLNGDRDVTAREILDQGAERIKNELAGSPQLEARLLNVLATAYRHLGEPRRSIELFQRAIALDLDARVDQPLAAAEALSQLAVVYANNNFPSRDAVAAARRSLALRQQHAPGDARTLADAWNTLGVALDSGGDYAAAEAALQKALALRRSQEDDQSDGVAATLHNLGLVADHRGDTAQAVTYYRQALDLKRSSAGEHSASFQVSLQGYAVAWAKTGERARALPLLERNLALCRELYGERSSHLAVAYNEFGSVLHDLGRFQDAATNYREAMRIHALVTGETSAAYAVPLNNLASAYEDMGDYPRAVPLFEQSLAIRSRTHAGDDAMVLRARHNLARVLTEAGRLAEAKPSLDAALAGFRARDGEDSPAVAKSELVQAQWFLRSGNADAAARTLDALVHSTAPFTPLMHAQRDALIADLAAVRHQSSLELTHRRAAWDTLRQAFGDTHPLSAKFALAYARTLREQGAGVDAEAIVAPLRNVIETAFVAASPARRQLVDWP